MGLLPLLPQHKTSLIRCRNLKLCLKLQELPNIADILLLLQLCKITTKLPVLMHKCASGVSWFTQTSLPSTMKINDYYICININYNNEHSLVRFVSFHLPNSVERPYKDGHLHLQVGPCRGKNSQPAEWQGLYFDQTAGLAECGRLEWQRWGLRISSKHFLCQG